MEKGKHAKSIENYRKTFLLVSPFGTLHTIENVSSGFSSDLRRFLFVVSSGEYNRVRENDIPLKAIRQMNYLLPSRSRTQAEV
jgi:hypothetical protein